MNDTPFQDFPAYVKQSSNRPKFLMLFVVILIVLALVVGGLYFVGGNTKKEAKKVAPVPTRALVIPSPVATQSAPLTVSPAKTKTTPTPLKKGGLERSDLKMAILNGSGVAGAAKQISSHLNSLGYIIAKIENADDFSYTGFTIKVKKSKSDYLALLKKDVATSASAGASVKASVDDTIATDAEVIVGK